MKLAKTNFTKLKACRKLAGGKARGRHPRLPSDQISTPAGVPEMDLISRVFPHPFRVLALCNRFPGVSALPQPPANFRQPFRLLKTGT